MPSKISFEPTGINDRLNYLLQWFIQAPMEEPIKKSAERIRRQFQWNIRESKDADGQSYPAVRQSTMEMEIKRGDPYEDRRVRGKVSQSNNAMSVTRQTIDSINSKRESTYVYNVGVDDERAQLVLASNAKPGGGGQSGFGRVSKAKRDPLGITKNAPSDTEIDIVEDEIAKAIERLIANEF